MADKKKTRKVVDVEKPERGGRYRTEQVSDKEKEIKPDVTKAGKFIGRDPVRRERIRGGKASGSKESLSKIKDFVGAKKKPNKSISRRVSVFTPGSQEARASKGRAVASSLGSTETESTNRKTSRSPRLLKGQREDVTFRPATMSKYTKTAPKGTRTVKDITPDATNFELPGGRDNPIFSDASIKNPKTGTFAAAGAERARHVDTFVRAGGRGPVAEAARAAFHAIKAPVGASETGICGAGGCTRTTEGGGGNCPDGTCNVVSAPMTLTARPKG